VSKKLASFLDPWQILLLGLELPGLENKTEARDDLLNPLRRSSTDFFSENGFINRDGLRNVDDAWFGDVRFSLPEKDIARRLRSG
jgi:hypothetical protein